MQDPNQELGLLERIMRSGRQQRRRPVFRNPRRNNPFGAGEKEKARRRRQIAKGQLTEANGLVRDRRTEAA